LASNYYIVGKYNAATPFKQIRTWNGSTYGTLTTTFTWNIGSIHGIDDNNIIVGEFQGNRVAIWNGAAWTVHTPTTTIADVHMVSATEMYVIANGGISGGQVYVWDGLSWSQLYAGDNQSQGRGIWAAGPDEIYFAGTWRNTTTNERIARWNGSLFEWDITSAGLGTPNGWEGIAGLDSNNIWFCDLLGVIYKGKWGGPWTLDYNGSGIAEWQIDTNNLSADTSDGSVYWAGRDSGFFGVVFKRNPGTGIWATEFTASNAQIRYSDVWASGDGTVMAVDQLDDATHRGTHAWFNSSVWSEQKDAGAVSGDIWYSIWGAAPPDLTPPTFSNQDPATNENNVDPATTVEFDITDDSGTVVLSTVVIYVGGATAYANSAAIGAWGAVVTPITGGYNFVLTPPAALNTVSVPVRGLAQDPSANQMDETYLFFPSLNTQLETIVISKKVIRLEFGNEIAPTAEIADGNSYQITKVSDGSEGVSVKEVIYTPRRAVTSVDLVVQNMENNVLYQVQVTGLSFALGGSTVGTTVGRFVSALTKVDYMASTLNSMYSKDTKSRVYSILAAMGYSDTLIGGDIQDPGPIPAGAGVTAVVSTMGSLGFGTGTFGG
jgi:hypothetical protein